MSCLRLILVVRYGLPLSERVSPQFRAEDFNILNHPSLAISAISINPRTNGTGAASLGNPDPDSR
jgi:hypothetical protein